MQSHRLATILMIAFATLLVACAGSASEPTPSPTPDPLIGTDVERGRRIFETGADLLERPCSDCHTLDRDDTLPSSVRLVAGPSLEGIGSRAGAVEYIQQSIKDPDAYVPEGYKAMSKLPGAILSEQDILDVTAFLLSLEQQ